MTPEAESLLSKARRSLAAAQALFARSDYDFATSRAYYAMLYAAEAALLSRGLSYRRHSAVISAFGRELVKTGALPAELHGWFRQAFDARAIGDYGAEIETTRDHAQQVLRESGAFVEKIEAFLGR